jgi:hypothetical protein
MTDEQKILVEKCGGKKQLRIPRHGRGEKILEWILKNIGCEGMDWIHLA